MLKWFSIVLALASTPAFGCEIGGCASAPHETVVMVPMTREVTAEERRHLIYDRSCADCQRGCSKLAHVALCPKAR